MIAKSQGRLPTFLIAGAMRCGTTSLNGYLRQHPQIAMSATKEVHFFDHQFHRGLDWYRSQFTTDPAPPAVGEASPNYLFHTEAPARIADTLPDARLVIVLRNPIDRAYSHYWLDRSLGKVTVPFTAAIDTELAGERFTYIARGRYRQQMERLFTLVDRRQVLVETFEEMIADPGSVFASVCRFIGVDDTVRPQILGESINAYTRYRSVRVRNLSKRLPRTARRAVGRLNQRPPARYEAMDPGTRQRLESVFAEANDGIDDLLGRSLPAWN